MNPTYSIERHRHGWLICAPPGQRGIPLDALNECLPLFPENSVMDSGITHHFNASIYHAHAVMAVATERSATAWRKAIDESIQHLDSENRWWRGTDVGTSSAALFSVFCMDRLKGVSNDMGRGSTPSDASDFGRCHRLLELFPDEWRERLPEVAAAYPETAWPLIIDRWAELEAADLALRTAILRECLKAHDNARTASTKRTCAGEGESKT